MKLTLDRNTPVDCPQVRYDIIRRENQLRAKSAWDRHVEEVSRKKHGNVEKWLIGIFLVFVVLWVLLAQF